MRWLSGLLVCLGLAVATSTAGPSTAGSSNSAPGLDMSAFRRVIDRLCSDEMEGRGVMTSGNQKATDFLEQEFKAAGLAPAGDNSGYRQCYLQPTNVSAPELWLSFGERRLSQEAVSAAPFSESGDFSGDLVMVGYGIHAPELNYDDYQGIQTQGKILLVMRYEPGEKDPKSPFNGDRPSRYSDLRLKVHQAKEHGAKAVLLVAPPRPGEEPDKKVPSLSGVEAQSSVGIVVLHVLPGEVDFWLKSKNTSLAEQVAAIDRDFASKSVDLGKVSGHARVARQERQLCNILGKIPGRGVLSKEAVVIGAHFDHLGYGQAGTMEPGKQLIHPGADDNASGTAGLLVLAKALTADAAFLQAPRRTIVFAAFNGEEIGMTGSSTYAAHPSMSLASTNAMLNLDMIGRLQNNQLTILGSESGDVWGSWLLEEAGKTGLNLVFIGDGYGPSDQTPFYSKSVPVLHFFTGATDDHHRPSDRPDRLNVQGAEAVLKLAGVIAKRTATSSIRVAYRETSSGPTLSGDSRGFDAYLGTIPDFTSMSPGASGGVLLGGVRKDSPAEKAGIKQKDRIVKMAGKSIDNLYDMTFVLRDHRPGDVIEVEVEREGKRLVVAATLGSRAGSAQGMKGDKPLMPPTGAVPGEKK